ncbi:unnamed protein product [Prorocentrum cordatum]|uniref:Uncharacterized protein n=1 Tax=Prorocentrum cordatum TaxID=2364126 RepID=A0ABN9XRB9_9DINO|nr:unnamed protein product [Polarella glacialis]
MNRHSLIVVPVNHTSMLLLDVPKQSPASLTRGSNEQISFGHVHGEIAFRQLVHENIKETIDGTKILQDGKGQQIIDKSNQGNVNAACPLFLISERVFVTINFECWVKEGPEYRELGVLEVGVDVCQYAVVQADKKGRSFNTALTNALPDPQATTRTTSLSVP